MLVVGAGLAPRLAAGLRHDDLPLLAVGAQQDRVAVAAQGRDVGEGELPAQVQLSDLLGAAATGPAWPSALRIESTSASKAVRVCPSQSGSRRKNIPRHARALWL